MQEFVTLPQGQFTPLADVTITGMVSAAINITLIIAVILFVFNLIFGGIKFILSGGDKERADNARRQLVNAIIGVFIVFSSWALLNLASEFFGVDLLNFEIPTL
jgi:cbb3-type cytochrome oxidase subunit 3